MLTQTYRLYVMIFMACTFSIFSLAYQDGRMLHLNPSAPNQGGAVQAKQGIPQEHSQAYLQSLYQFSNKRDLGKEPAKMNGCDISPVSPAVGAEIPELYFGPAPSTVDPRLIGPLQLLTAGVVDSFQGTITLPIYRGEMAHTGEPVWYVLTDTTDEGNASALGLNFAPKLNYADTGRGVRPARLERDGLLVFEYGMVDFSPEHVVTPGPEDAPFPPNAATPGGVGDSLYTPLVKIVNAGGHVYNAPVIAMGVTADEIDFPNGNPDYRLVHDKVLSIDMEAETVTLALTPGFSFARPVLYLSLDASAPDVAALESAVYAPGLLDIEVGNDDSAFSAVERIFVTINGPRGCENPQRQGIESALTDGRAPFNVLGGIPTVATDYSPLWDMNLGEWSPEAVEKGYRSRLNEEFQILGLAEQGFLTGPGGAEYGSVGVIINCPIVFRFL